MNNAYDNEEFFKEYAKMYRSQKGLEGAGEWHQLQPLFPDLAGKKVLDLGCGYGWHCKYAIECGASSVLGIDLSEKMIETAKEKNADERITYQVCGLDTYDYPENTYDCVVSNLVLHYIDDLDFIYKNIYRTLTKSGFFLFNIEHPVFTGSVNQDWIYDSNGKALYWPVDNYFYSGMRKTHFLGQDVMKQHHTLTEILNGLVKAGFSIEAVEEAMPEQSMMDIPGMKDQMRRPMMLLVKAKKNSK
jgi:SAM-dependent methyltransferase